MAGDSIGKLSLKIDGDATGLGRATQQAKREVADLTGGGAGAFGGLGNLFGAAKDFLGIGGLITGGLSGAVMAVKELANSFRESGKEVKELQLASEKAGVSFDWMQRAKHYAEQVGIELENVISGLARLRRNAYDGIFGTMDSKEAMKQIGLGDDALLMSREKFYETVATKILAIGDSFKRAAVEVAIFGKSGQDLELWMKKLAAGEKEPLISKESASALRQFAEEWREIEEKVHAWWVNLKGSLLELVGFGKTHAQLADDAFRARQKEARESREMAASMEKAKKDSAISEGDKLQASLVEKMSGMTPEQIARDKALKAQWSAGIQPRYDEIDAIQREIDAAKILADARNEVKRAVEASLTAEEKFVKATAEAHRFRQMGVATAQQEASLIQKAQEELLKHWKTEEPKLAGGYERGSSEEYRFRMEDRMRQIAEANNQQRIMELQLDAQREANANLAEMNRKMGKPPAVATMGGA